MHRKIYADAKNIGCTVYAINGTEDHVHMVVRMPSTLSPSNLMKKVKGNSSVLYNDIRPEFSERFDWQQGYGCFSIGQSREELDRIIEYVRRQREHHAADTLIEEWEKTIEIIPKKLMEDFF
jgi:putative transposase